MDRFERVAAGWIGGLVTLLLVVVVAAAAGWFFYCPCERTPGGWLLGEAVSEPVADWSFANDVPLCQIQVRAGLLPHSINLNCMASAGALYLSCAQCEGKTWSTAALANPSARLRLGERVYPVTLARVEDAATLDEAWRARETKLGRDPERPREAGWWSFRVEFRG
ncbi:MAG: hypothetical protein KF911_06370 [Pseudomonadales bacterium]|nr:hypothetical protein [Pseudomonadales bacterium]